MLVCVVVRTSSCRAKLSKLAAAARPSTDRRAKPNKQRRSCAREGAWTLPHGNSRKRHICICLRVLQQHQSRDSPPQHSLHRPLPASYTIQMVAIDSYARFAFQCQPSSSHLTSRGAPTAQLRAGHFRGARFSRQNTTEHREHVTVSRTPSSLAHILPRLYIPLRGSSGNLAVCAHFGLHALSVCRRPRASRACRCEPACTVSNSTTFGERHKLTPQIERIGEARTPHQ